MEDRLMVDMRISADCTEMEAEDTVIPSKDARRGEWRLPRRGQKGFTIVEVLVALLILLATATMTAQLSIQAIHTSYSQQQRSTAMTLSPPGRGRGSTATTVPETLAWIGAPRPAGSAIF